MQSIELYPEKRQITDHASEALPRSCGSNGNYADVTIDGILVDDLLFMFRKAQR